MKPHDRIFQVFETRHPIQTWKKPGRLLSRIKLPHGPQFWIEAAEAVVNWFLRLLKMAEPMEEHQVSFNRLTIDREQIGRAVVEHVHNFIRSSGDQPGCVLMGRDHFRPFVGELHSALAFDATFRLRVQSRYQQMEYCGVRVVLIPWMEGMIALPDLRKELAA